MSKSTKFLLILIIIFLLLGVIKSKQNDLTIPSQNKNTTNGNGNINEEKTVSYGDNLILSFDIQATIDINGDTSFDELYGDKLIKEDEVYKQSGIKVLFEIYDSNNNGTIDINETTHAKLIISNNSAKEYTIQTIKIIGQGSTFSEGDFTNLKTTNAGEIDYSFDGVDLTYPENQAYILPPNYTSTFEFDIKWSNEERITTISNSDYNEAPYVGITFIASAKDEDPYYIEIFNETMNFSTQNVEPNTIDSSNEDKSTDDSTSTN